jgi:hypothetical protein
VYAHLISEFSRRCCARIAAGEPLSPAVAAAFLVLLEARERSGHRLLGAMAGPDPSFDTVTGRCGLPPAFLDISSRGEH